MIEMRGPTNVLNVELSWKMAKRIRARPGQCYRNAWRLVERVITDGSYVEGMAVLPGPLLIEHGWVEYRDQIVDPTITDRPVVYFPALRWAGREGLDQAYRTPGMAEAGYFLPIFFRFGWGGCQSAEMRATRVAAERHAFGESLSEKLFATMDRPPGDLDAEVSLPTATNTG